MTYMVFLRRLNLLDRNINTQITPFTISSSSRVITLEPRADEPLYTDPKAPLPKISPHTTSSYYPSA